MSFWKESNITTATHHNNKIWYQKLGETISHFAKNTDLLQLACKTKKTNTNSSHSLYTYPHIFKPRRKKTQLKNKLTKSPPHPSP
jgi:hypothetical protein